MTAILTSSLLAKSSRTFGKCTIPPMLMCLMVLFGYCSQYHSSAPQDLLFNANKALLKLGGFGVDSLHEFAPIDRCEVPASPSFFATMIGCMNRKHVLEGIEDETVEMLTSSRFLDNFNLKVCDTPPPYTQAFTSDPQDVVLEQKAGQNVASKTYGSGFDSLVPRNLDVTASAMWLANEAGGVLLSFFKRGPKVSLVMGSTDKSEVSVLLGAD